MENIIKDYLDKRAETDPILAEKLKNPKKNIKECLQYIMGEAHKRATGGSVMIADEEVYGWAVHYYDEENIEVEKINHHAEVTRRADPEYVPTEEEKEQARQMAMKRLEQEAYEKMHAPKKKIKSESTDNQMSLFA